MEQHRSFPWGVLLIVSLAVFILVIDTTTMEVSINALMHDLNTSASTIQTIIALCTLVKAAFMLIGANFRTSSGGSRHSCWVLRFMASGISRP